MEIALGPASRCDICEKPLLLLLSHTRSTVSAGRDTTSTVLWDQAMDGVRWTSTFFTRRLDEHKRPFTRRIDKHTEILRRERAGIWDEPWTQLPKIMNETGFHSIVLVVPVRLCNTCLQPTPKCRVFKSSFRIAPPPLLD
jgi:hypothetical protein